MFLDAYKDCSYVLTLHYPTSRLPKKMESFCYNAKTYLCAHSSLKEQFLNYYCIIIRRDGRQVPNTDGIDSQILTLFKKARVIQLAGGVQSSALKL